MSVFLETLSHIPWHITENVTDIDESWQMFKDLLFSVVEIPRFKWRKRKLKHWFSIHLIQQKRRLYSHIIQSSTPPLPSLLRKYRSLSNIVRGMTRQDTNLKLIQKKLSKNPRKFWAWVNSSKGRRAKENMSNFDSLRNSLNFTSTLLLTIKFYHKRYLLILMFLRLVALI